MLASLKSKVRPIIRKWSTDLERWSYGRDYHEDTQVVNETIVDIVKASRPAAIGKIGSVELDMLRLYLHGSCPYSPKWRHRANRLHVCPGIFPEEPEATKAWCEAFVGALEDLDVLGVWFNPGESRIARRYCKNALKVNCNGIEPFTEEDPWTMQLEGKSVLVINPFRDSIRSQYEKRQLVWGDRKILPGFRLLQIKMPLSNALVPSKHASWSEQLDDLKRQMDELDYDVALIGAGGYSLLLAQHAKKSAKIGIHLGGSTQMLFGVYGSRWLNSPNAKKMINEHWATPSPEELPSPQRCAEVGRDNTYW